jgi:hypothetical protein
MPQKRYVLDAEPAKRRCDLRSVLAKTEQRGNAVVRDANPIVLEFDLLIVNRNFDFGCAGIQGVVNAFAN